VAGVFVARVPRAAQAALLDDDQPCSWNYGVDRFDLVPHGARAEAAREDSATGGSPR
jgi:hypothetical protein